MREIKREEGREEGGGERERKGEGGEERERERENTVKYSCILLGCAP